MSSAVLRELARDAAGTPERWLAVAERAEGNARILAIARAVGEGHDPAALTSVLAGVPRPDDAAAKELTSTTDAIVERGRARGIDPTIALTRIADAIASGADASYLLRGAARVLDTAGASTAALAYMHAALAIAPSDRAWYRDTLALILLNQARFDDAAREVETLAAVDADQARWIRAYVTELRRPVASLWPKKYVDGGVADDASTTARSLDEVRAQISLVAARVTQIVASLRETSGGARLELPDVSAFEPKATGGPTLELGPGLADRLLQLRREWLRLTWVLVLAGAKEPAPVTAVGPAPDPFDFIETIATVRFNLLIYRADGRTLVAEDDLDEQAMALEWGGVPMTEIAPHVAGYWANELAVLLAVVRWASGQNPDVFADP